MVSLSKASSKNKFLRPSIQILGTNLILGTILSAKNLFFEEETMRKADFKARIKKIEIVNRVLSDSWQQSIRVILEDIELSNENLLELKQFMPNENVVVEITPVQVSLFDAQVPNKGQKNSLGNSDELNSDDEISLTFIEDEEVEDEGSLVKEWMFSAG